MSEATGSRRPQHVNPASGDQHDSELAFTVLANGDEIERSNWERLQPYIHRYEAVWQVLVAPLRAPNSIMFRDGIDEDFEEFAMCHYTTYVNLARALNKMECRQDDLKFADEIWLICSMRRMLRTRPLRHSRKSISPAPFRDAILT